MMQEIYCLENRQIFNTFRQTMVECFVWFVSLLVTQELLCS